MSRQINNLALYVNGDQVAYEADSLEWTEGFGEKMVRNVVVGGGQTQQVVSEDIKTKSSNVKFQLPTTADNLKFNRQWNTNLNNNVIEINGVVDGQVISRIFTGATVTNDPSVKIATEGTLDFEWKSNPAQ